jgi:putative multiple sugar transport system substrate-binding protein
MKHLLAILMTLSLLLALSSCGGGNASAAQNVFGGTETAQNGDQSLAGKKVGIAMPTQSSERWINDGKNMKAKLEAKGAEVVLQFGDDDIQQQIYQIEGMIAQQVDCLVIAAIDSVTLTIAEQTAADAGIPIIAYDRLLMETENVDYYATFDNKGVGVALAQYVEQKLDLPNAKANGKTYTCELFMGSPDDNNALFVYNGVMEVLGGYFEDGTLEAKTGRTSFEDTCILRWSQETAQQWCENYLASAYANDHLDICMCAADCLAHGVKAALTSAGYTRDNWPIVTGQDCELMAVKNIVDGWQTVSMYKDTRLLAEKCVTMVEAVLLGTEPEINDTEQYNNNVKAVPTYMCTPVAVDKDNYKELLIDSGYYTENQIRSAS